MNMSQTAYAENGAPAGKYLCPTEMTNQHMIRESSYLCRVFPILKHVSLNKINVLQHI
jgi:hypothetical protein